MKAGLLEVADIVVVNKADHPDADRTLRDLREQRSLVLRTIALRGEGIPELVAVIAEQQRVKDLELPAGQDSRQPALTWTESGG